MAVAGDQRLESAAPSLYGMIGAGNYWVIQRAGYDVDAFTTETEARKRLVELRENEHANATAAAASSAAE